MDNIDVAIIRELTQGGLILPSRPGFAPSYRQVSKKLGVPLGTVRNRINGMYRSGVLKGSSLYPNPGLLGLRTGAYTVDVPNAHEKRGVFRKLKQSEGVFSGHDFIGSRAWVVFFYEDDQDLEGRLRHFKDIAGPDGVLSQIPFPPCPVEATRAEAELILRLSNKGFGSYAELGKELGVPLRTLKRRMSRVVSQNMILSIPIVDYGAIEECVPVDLLVFFENSEARAEGEPKVIELLKDYVILAALFDVVGMCSLILPKVALANELADKVRQVPGVKQAWAEIVSEHVHYGAVLAEYMERQMSSSPLKKSGERRRVSVPC